VPRVVFLWAVLRAAVALAPDVAGLAAPPTAPTAAAPPLLAPGLNILAIALNTAVISLLVALDLRATREQPLLANLGIGLRHTAVMTAGIIVPLEILFFLATTMAGSR
jgi:hypothetical protein